ncbi:MAG: histidine phosphatase family protein, partial [Alphaproteobacteria bacterium]|nr:histidine phosphatase family protein [Alphaproteobacteria bacterium]
TTFGLEEIEFIVDERLKEATFHVAATLPDFQVPHVYERQSSTDLSYEAFKKSLKQFLDDVVNKENSYENIFLYTHGGVIKTLLRIIHDNDAICYTVHNCSITKLTWYRSRWHLNFLNDVSFIPKEYRT